MGKIEETDKPLESFGVLEAGKSVMQIQEGVELRVNEETGSKTLNIPMKCVEVVEGPDSNVGGMLFCTFNLVTGEAKGNTVNELGEIQVNALINHAGILSKVKEKFGSGDIDFTDDAFVDFLAIHLPGCVVRATHKVGEWNDKKRAEWVGIYPHKKKNVDTGSTASDEY